MMNSTFKFMVALVLLATVMGAFAQSTNSTNSIIDIGPLAKEFCKTVEPEGSRTSLGANAKIKVGLLARIIQMLSVEVEGEALNENWENIPQADLANLKVEEMECRLEFLRIVKNSFSTTIEKRKLNYANIFNMGVSIANAECALPGAHAKNSLKGAIDNAKVISLIPAQTVNTMEKSLGSTFGQPQLIEIVKLLNSDLSK